MDLNDSKIDVNPEGGRPPEGRRVSWANTADVKTLAYVQETRKQRFKRILAQVLAATVKNMMLLDLGMIVGFPTILIPAIHNAKEGLSLNDEETSWIGSITMICQPVGSLLSGVILEGVGRKHAMMLINGPLLAGWLLFYWASTPGLLYAAFCILGLCVGFMEAPTLTYIAEICEPRLRGVLTSYSETCVTLGMLVEYLLGSASHWQTAALVSAALPVLTLAALTQVPETPMWLLSRGRTKEAESSLRWLRGWASPGAVRGELASLSAYADRSAALDRTPPPRPRRRPSAAAAGGDVMTLEEEQLAAALAALHERHRGSQNFPPVGLAVKREEGGTSSEEEEDCCQLPLCRKTAAMLQGPTLRPLTVVAVYFLLQHWTAVSGLRPYMVEVCDKLGVPGDPHWDTVVIGLATLLGFIVCILTMKRLGKRRLSLFSFGSTAVSCLLLGWYSTSKDPPVGTWAPLTLLVLIFFFAAVGISPIPWILLSEVFPFRTRGLASGVVAALSYVFGFSASKTFFDLEASIGLAGLFFLYGAVGLVGFAFVYFFLIETEGRSLEDIEKDYCKGPPKLDGAILEHQQQQQPRSVVRRSVIKKTTTTNSSSGAVNGLVKHSAEQDGGDNHVGDLGNQSGGQDGGNHAGGQDGGAANGPVKQSAEQDGGDSHVADPGNQSGGQDGGNNASGADKGLVKHSAGEDGGDNHVGDLGNQSGGQDGGNHAGGQDGGAANGPVKQSAEQDGADSHVGPVKQSVGEDGGDNHVGDPGNQSGGQDGGAETNTSSNPAQDGGESRSDVKESDENGDVNVLSAVGREDRVSPPQDGAQNRSAGDEEPQPTASKDEAKVVSPEDCKSEVNGDSSRCVTRV